MIEQRIEAHALLNAVKYGKAIPGKVVPKILGEFPEEKANMKELVQKIQEIVANVNGLEANVQQKRLEELAPELLEKKEQPKRELPPLENAEMGKVVTRLPPEPSKYNHLGHALTFLLNEHYARTYEGKLILRFEDANPEKVTQEFVDMMLSDITEYLAISPDDVLYVSDDMEKLLEFADKLVDCGAAYMCFCPREKLSENRRAGVACPCRENNNHTEEWEQFKKGAYMNGECVLRFKGDMQSKNTVMRDPVLWRAVAKEHFRKGKEYHIWPLYDFYSAIEEHLSGVTHVIRSNEFDLRVELQNAIQEALALPKPEIVHYGRFNITGATTKGREIRAAIESGEFIGWDDPRLVTLQALRRRGIQQEAFRKLVQQLGLSPYQVNLDFSMLAAANRELIEPVANRYSFVQDPVEIVVHNAPTETVELHLHPDKKDGGRTFAVGEKFYVAKSDHEQFGAFVRFKDHCTFSVEGSQYVFLKKEHTEKSAAVIQWLPADSEQHVPVAIMMPDATTVVGIAEKAISSLEVGTIVQFERFGFCRLDEKGETYTFWYTHE